jgi:hypothetical protein
MNLKRIWKRAVCHNGGTTLEFAWRGPEVPQYTSFSLAGVQVDARTETLENTNLGS